MPPRLRRILELAYAVEGVVAARIWQWPGCVAIGIRGGGGASPSELLRRVEIAVAAVRDPAETWDYGILEDPEAPLAESKTEPTAAVSSQRRSLRSPF
jgi:hypothetical protein